MVPKFRNNDNLKKVKEAIAKVCDFNSSIVFPINFNYRVIFYWWPVILSQIESRPRSIKFIFQLHRQNVRASSQKRIYNRVIRRK